MEKRDGEGRGGIECLCILSSARSGIWCSVLGDLLDLDRQAGKLT